MTALLFVCAFLPFIKHTQNAMSVQINRAPSPSTSQSSVTWHHLTFSPPLALLLLSQSASFVLAAFERHRLCAGGRAGIWLSWLQLHHLFLGEDTRATVTPVCSAVIFTACGTDSGLVLPFLPFFNLFFIVGRIMQLYDAVSDLYYAFQSSFTSWKTDSLDAPVVYIVRNRYT